MSEVLPHDAEDVASVLRVIRFQDDFAFPIDPYVLSQFASIAWEKHTPCDGCRNRPLPLARLQPQRCPAGRCWRPAQQGGVLARVAHEEAIAPRTSADRRETIRRSGVHAAPRLTHAVPPTSTAPRHRHPVARCRGRHTLTS